MKRVSGQLRLIPDESRPHAAGAGGSGGGGGRGPAAWRIVEGATARIGGHLRTFEMAGWRATEPLAADDGPIDETPDWICEPAEEGRAAQLSRYLRLGILHVWLLGRTVEVYRLARSTWEHVATERDNARLGAEPFDDVELDLSSLWTDVDD